MIQAIFSTYYSCLCIFIRNAQKQSFVTLLGALAGACPPDAVASPAKRYRWDKPEKMDE